MYVKKYPNCAFITLELRSSYVDHVPKPTRFFPLQVQYGPRMSQPCSRLVPVKGLVPAANMNGSQSKGFVIFIRGKYQTEKELEELEANKKLPVSGSDENKNVPLSKESRVAKLYE